MLEKLLNELVEEFDCQVKESNEFAYYYAQSLVCFTREKDAVNDKAFLEFARANGLNEKVDAFTISFFHEVGHNETIDDVEEEFDGDKNALTLEQYFNLEEEWLATEWAIDFCNNNIEVVEKIQQFL